MSTYLPIWRKPTEITGATMTDDTMPPKERDELVLRFLHNHDVALPPTPLFFNLKRKHSVTFSKKTLRRRLTALRERGLVNYIDEGDGYYEVNEAGFEWLREREAGGDE